MAIVRTEINGNIATLKEALETLVPSFFASVSYDNDSTPTAVQCKDADGNTIMECLKQSSASYGIKAYKDAENFIGKEPSSTAGLKIMDFYKVGSNGAVMRSNNGYVFIVAKTNTGKTAFAFPHWFSTIANTQVTVETAFWGDDTTMTDWIVISGAGSGSSNPLQTNSIGYQCLFVPIPAHGTFSQSIYLPKAFFLPMAQQGMRGVFQEVVAENGTHLTNGYVTLLDDGGAA